MMLGGRVALTARQCCVPKALASTHHSTLTRTMADNVSLSRVNGAVCTFDPNTAPMAHYLHSIVNAEQHPALAWIRSETTRRFPRWAIMTSSIDTARLLATLVCTTGARRVIEIGTFTGYSSLAMAWAMPKQDAKVVCLDNSEEFTDVAREAWKRAGVESIMELRLDNATESLKRLVADPQWLGQVDMVLSTPTRRFSGTTLSRR